MTTYFPLRSFPPPPVRANHLMPKEVRTEQTSPVLIAPVWQNRLWYSTLLQSLADYPILLPPVENILIGHESQNHALLMQGHLPLAAWPISGSSNLRAFR